MQCSMSYFFVMSSDGELCKTLKAIEGFFVRNRTSLMKEGVLSWSSPSAVTFALERGSYLGRTKCGRAKSWNSQERQNAARLARVSYPRLVYGRYGMGTGPLETRYTLSGTDRPEAVGGEVRGGQPDCQNANGIRSGWRLERYSM